MGTGRQAALTDGGVPPQNGAVDLEEFIGKAISLFRSRGAERVYLFGSYAREEADRRSDVDLLVIDDDDLPYLRRLDKYFDELSHLARGGLDLFVLRPAELEGRRGLPFYDRVIKDGRIIYERCEEPA